MSSSRYTVSRKEITEDWSINDVYDANIVLDLYDEVENRAMQK